MLKAPASLENGSTYLHKTFASYNRSSYQPSVSIVYTNPFYSAFEDSSFSVNGSSVTIKGTASLYSSTSNFQSRANCYAYALQTHFDINAPYPIYNGRTTAYLQIPGEFIDKSTAIPITLPNGETYNLTSTSSVLELWEEHIFPISEKNAPPVREYVFLRNTVEFLIKSDLEAMGYSAQFTNSSAVNLPTTASKRLIIMVLGTNINEAGTNDYHFYMQHTDGTWSHKRGNTPVEASNHLSNAEEVLENAQSLKYDDYTFYFYVTMPASRDHCHSDGISDLNCPYTSTSPTTDLAGEYFASAQQIKPLETICASIGYSGDIDTYVLVANTTQYQFHITSEGTNVNPLTMVIYNENGNVLRIETISSSNTGYILSNLQTGIYYIRLFESFPHSVGPYPSYTFSVQYLTT